MLEPEEAGALLVLALLQEEKQKRRKPSRRKVWVHPLLTNRKTGAFSLLFPQLLSHEDKFFNYFRMSRSSFEELHDLIQHRIHKEDTTMRQAISTQERLAITLRYLATGCTLTDLHYSYKCGISTLSGIVEEVCEVLWELSSQFLAVPSEDDWLSIASDFERTANFPHCLGAIDGKHIRIIKPKDSGSLYRNYKHYFSIVLLAICDSNYLFRAVDIGAYGKQSDSGLFENTTIWKRMLSNTLNIPPACPIVEGGCDVNYVFVGDEAFGLSKHIMRPFAGNSLTIKQRVFNYRLSRARRFVECSFGILANKWRIFHRPLNVRVHFAENIVKACVVLHNFVRLRDGMIFEETLITPTTLQDAPIGEGVPGQSYSRQPRDMRNHLADYFVGPGQLEWQYNMI